MTSKEESLAILYHNQISHFDDLRSRGIDPGIPDEEVYSLIESVYANSIQSQVFTLHAMQKKDTPVKYLNSARRRPPPPVPSDSVEGQVAIGDFELSLASYVPSVHEISLFSGDLFRELLKPGKGEQRHILEQNIKRTLNERALALVAEATEASSPVIFNAEGGSQTESYLLRAQEVSQGIKQCGDIMYKELMRGGVSHILSDVTSATYFRLNTEFTRKDASCREGIYEIGEVLGLPILKVPSGMPIEEGTSYCIWKNSCNELDVSIAFCVYIPFYFNEDTKVFSVMGDYEVLQPKFIKKLQIQNIITS